MRKFSYVLFVVLVLCATATAQDRWENYFQGGMRALQSGDLGRAELLLKASRLKAELEAESGNPDAPAMIIDSLSGIALVLRQEGRPAEAEQILKEQLDALKSFHRGDSDPQTSMTLHNLGLVLFDQDKFDDAKKILSKAVDLRRKYDPPPKRNLAISLLSLSAVYANDHNSSSAQQPLLEARQILEKITGNDRTPEDAAAIMRSDHNLALLYVEQKKYELAEEHFKRSIEMMEKLYGVTSPSLVRYLNNYANLLKLLNRTAEAKVLIDRAEALKNEPSRFEVPKSPNP